MITCTGFDHASFRYLLERFSPVYDGLTPYDENGCIRPKKIQGRPRTFDNTFGLALVLMWYRTRGSCIILGMCFGSTNSPLSIFLRFGRRCLLEVLKLEEKSAVKMAVDEDVVQGYLDSVAQKYTVLGSKRVCYGMDG